MKKHQPNIQHTTFVHKMMNVLYFNTLFLYSDYKLIRHSNSNNNKRRRMIKRIAYWKQWQVDISKRTNKKGGGSSSTKKASKNHHKTTTLNRIQSE